MTSNYDSENQLTSMNSGTVTLVYDGFGNRVSKTVGEVTTQYLIEDDVNPTGYPQVFDELVGGAVTRTYTYGLQRIDENQVIGSAWTPSFYGYDGGWNVRQLTNASGTVTDTYDYDAWGNLLNSTGTTPNNYLYRAEQYDSDLGLYYLRARYYNPLTGRFMSRDPDDHSQLSPNDLYKYLYAGGDPVNAIDPAGRGFFDSVLVTGGSALTTFEATTIFVGGVASEAATAAVAAILEDIAAADSVAEAVAEYQAAVRTALAARGLYRIIACNVLALGATYLGIYVAQHELQIEVSPYLAAAVAQAITAGTDICRILPF